jgi:hypothetical protein
MHKLAVQPGRHANADRGFDSYPTPPIAVEALLGVEELPRRNWEPAAGRGAIVTVLRDHGHVVIASDIVDYDDLDFVEDFFAMTKAPNGCRGIVTNPPFRVLRLTFICSCGWPS